MADPRKDDTVAAPCCTTEAAAPERDCCTPENAGSEGCCAPASAASGPCCSSQDA
jgi:hypothetical protein